MGPKGAFSAGAIALGNECEPQSRANGNDHFASQLNIMVEEGSCIVEALHMHEGNV